jgi:apolipoprotein N-acyltransferase
LTLDRTIFAQLRPRPAFVDAVALFAGIVLPLAFAPFGIFPVALISPLMLFVCWRGATPRRAFLRGWLYGAGAFGAGVFWIHESFQFSNIGLGVAIPLTIAFVAYLALFPALQGYIARRFSVVSESARLLLIYPSLWVLGEWLRGWLFTGFGWLQLGYSQIDSPLAGFLPLTGVYGVSWLVVVVAALILHASSGNGRVRAAAVGVTAAVLLAGGILRGVSWSEDAGAVVKVALVQGNIPQDQKWLPSMRQPTLDRYLGLTRRHWDADLVVWPESAVPGFLHRMRSFIDGVDAEAQRNQTQVLLGIPALDPAAGKFTNSVVLVGSAGGIYHKRHLVPFGEYLPLDSLLRPVTEAAGIPVSNFSPGPQKQSLLRAAGYPVALSVCYEIAFGSEIIRDLPEARFLVTVSNDAWFGTSIGPHQHLEIARVRALESGRFLLRATNTGITAVIAPDGRVAARLAQFEAGVLEGEITPRFGATPYVRLGDYPFIAAMFLLLAAPWLGPRLEQRHRKDV